MHPTIQQLLTFLLGATAFHGLFLSILIYTKGKHHRANRFLVWTLVALSLYLLNYLLFLTNIIREIPHLLNVFYTAVFLIGPTFYFFVKSSLGEKWNWKLTDSLHLSPFLFFLGKSSSVFALTAPEKLSIIEQIYEPTGHFTWWDMVTGNYPIYILMGYVLAAWLLMEKARDKATLIKTPSIHQIKDFCIAILVLVVSDLILQFGAFAFATPIFEVEYLLAALLAIIVHLLAYAFLNIIPSTLPSLTINNKYKTSALDEIQIKRYQQQVLFLLEKEQLWMQPNLKIADLAKSLNLPSHQLSQVLNEGLQTNFFDLINQYRIEEIKRRLVQPDFKHYSILAIALDCGFNNKATFNRVFKKMTGMTPSAFASKVTY